MARRPNILFLMTDQMQGRVLDPANPCQTPNLDALAGNGMRIRNAYTPNAVCSPARASLMTGLLPHNHGVVHVTQTVDNDQGCLRLQHPHWAQRLEQAGYRTGYFGKWHVERTDRLEQFGWQVNGVSSSELFRNKQNELGGHLKKTDNLTMSVNCDMPLGFESSVHYGITGVPAERRGVGVTTAAALDFLEETMRGDAPWCCFVSVVEPHGPYICGQDAYDRYDVDALELQPNAHDDLSGRPGLYRKVRRTWEHLTDRQRREALACYYASITEIDEQFGRILKKLQDAGQTDHTLIVFTSDHGDLLGAHGMYAKNVSAGEEVYNIPLIMAGPGIAKGVVSDARVGLHDLCQTLLELAGCETIAAPDSSSFAPLLADPRLAGEYRSGFAEYSGTRMLFSQRVVWNGPWKYVCNGFDIDELYNLDDDPYELNNLIDEPAHDPELRRLSAQMWRVIKETGDKSLMNLGPTMRVTTYGPGIGRHLPGE